MLLYHFLIVFIQGNKLSHYAPGYFWPPLCSENAQPNWNLARTANKYGILLQGQPPPHLTFHITTPTPSPPSSGPADVAQILIYLSCLCMIQQNDKKKVSAEAGETHVLQHITVFQSHEGILPV